MRLEREALEQIEAVRGRRSAEGVLSVYLPIDPNVALHHGHVAQLMDILKQLRASTPEDGRERLAEESERVLAYVREEYTPHGSMLVLFSSIPAGLWAALPLQVSLPALARFEEAAFLEPLAAALEDLPPAAIVLADQQQARIIRTALGESGSAARIDSNVPGRQRQGGWAAFRYERDRAEHVESHLRKVAAAIEDLAKDYPFHFLVLAGTDEVTHALTGFLPEALRERIAGSFRIEMFASDSDVVDAALPLIEAAERRHETELVDELVERAFAGGKAALGVDETLQTLREGRAHILAIGEHAYYSDLGHEAASLAWAAGTAVEVVHGEAEEKLAPHAGLAAALRY